MCGINGIAYRSSDVGNTLSQQLAKMNNLIIHRGPDDQGFYLNNQNHATIGMAMRRLSIIDLHSGQQPMYSEDGTIALVFNGEIYNYKKLRKQLTEFGVSFKTESDTEVILKLYETYGTSAFSKLDGMYAFSIHDKNKNKILIARDFFGEKPLYYFKNNDKIIWGSELKSILKVLNQKPELDHTGLNLFFRLTYIPAPFTIYQGIKKLQPNSIMELDLKAFTCSISTINKINAIIDTQKLDVNFDSAKTLVREEVMQSVASRSIADVPLGTFLSGGVDSSIVSLCLSKIKDEKINTFSIGFNKTSFDETDKSRTVAKLIGSNHNEFIIGEKDLEKNIEEIILNFDEPFADSSALPTYLVSNKTSKHVKVALTGDGGDEIFGGYNKYYIGNLNQKYTSLIPKRLHRGLNTVIAPLLNQREDIRGKRYKLKKLLNAINYDGDFYWNILSLGFTNSELLKYLTKDVAINKDLFQYYKDISGISKPTTLSDFRTIDRFLSLEGDMLVKVDRTSMLNSLECRSPFLNKKLFELSMRLPESYLLNGMNKKRILKAAFETDFPKGFLEKSKQGFGIPVGDWLRSSLRKELESFINPNFLSSQGIFNSTLVNQLIKQHLQGKTDSSFNAWTFYCFQKWYSKIYCNL